MANPKRKISRSKRDMRRAHWVRSLRSGSTETCENCGGQKLRHRVCPECGYYKGRFVYQPKNS